MSSQVEAQMDLMKPAKSRDFLMYSLKNLAGEAKIHAAHICKQTQIYMHQTKTTRSKREKSKEKGNREATTTLTKWLDLSLVY